MFGVFQNIDPPPAGEVCIPSPPPPLVRGRAHSVGGEGGWGGGQYFGRRQIPALYSAYVSTLWVRHSSVNQSTSFVRVDNLLPRTRPAQPAPT
jgi:hypothetical protein